MYVELVTLMKQPDKIILKFMIHKKVLIATYMLV